MTLMDLQRVELAFPAKAMLQVVDPRDPEVRCVRQLSSQRWAGAVFIILELDGPLDVWITVQSEPLRHALGNVDEKPSAGRAS